MDLRLAHIFAGGHGDAALLGLIDGAIEMINHTIVLHNEALMGEETVELLARLDEIGTFPVVPVHKILRAGEGVVGLVFAGWIEGAEVEHGVETLRHLYEIRKAINANPTGIGATLAMNDLYLETTTEFIKTYRLLKVSIAKGGTDNMLTGAERTEMLWQLNDELARLNAKLRTLAISIAYHNFTDVWNQYTAGMVDKNHADIAHDAYDRWRRASTVAQILSE